jgi:hypothetical protein
MAAQPKIYPIKLNLYSSATTGTLVTSMVYTSLEGVGSMILAGTKSGAIVDNKVVLDADTVFINDGGATSLSARLKSLENSASGYATKTGVNGQKSSIVTEINNLRTRVSAAEGILHNGFGGAEAADSSAIVVADI